MWPFKNKTPADTKLPPPLPCNFRLVSYRWYSSDGSDGCGQIFMQSNPGIDGDDLKSSDVTDIINVIKREVVVETNALNPKIVILGMSYLGYMTEKEFYS